MMNSKMTNSQLKRSAEGSAENHEEGKESMLKVSLYKSRPTNENNSKSPQGTNDSLAFS